MNHALNASPTFQDLFMILGIPATATGEEIRAAYLTKIKEFPPDREPARFELIRDAYEILKDPYRKTEYLLKAPQAPYLRQEFVDALNITRNRVPQALWFDALRSAYELEQRTISDE